MKTISLVICQLLCMVAVTIAAAEKPVAVSQKLNALLAVSGKDGKPVIGAEQRAYVDGLNEHLKALLSEAAEKEIITKPDHLNSILSLGLRPQKMEILLQDNCVLCHTDPEVQKPETIFLLRSASDPTPPRRSLHDFVNDVHFRRGLSCAGCHGGDPSSDKLEHSFVKEWPSTGRDKDGGWILPFCARCHSDPAFMNKFNPAMPTDQLAKYKDSPHGKLLLETKDLRAPQCISCHGVHGIRAGKDPLSLVYRKRLPETCGACHADAKKMAGFKLANGSAMPTNQLAEYRASVHGHALLERGDLGAPACNSCHGNHAAMPVGLATVSQSCGLCHSGNASLFDGSKHKVAFEQHNWAQCGQCHGNHGIKKTHDGLLGSGPESLCANCHQNYAQNNPECNATAAYFHTTITQMDKSWKAFATTTEALAMKGLDVDRIQEQMTDLADTLKQSRSRIHSFSKSDFDKIAAPGEKAIQRISTLVDQAKKEYRLRQLGLAASIALIGLLMITLYLKLRRLES